MLLDQQMMAREEIPDVGRRVRTLRERKGFSLRALARRSGLSLNAISLIERGVNSPTVSSLHLLANALNVPITDFFQDRTQQAVIFLKPDERPQTRAKGISLESLGSGLRNQQGEPFWVTVEPGAGNIDQPITHAGEEFVLCLQGTVDYQIGEQVYALEKGCSLLFKAMLPHGFSNNGNELATLLMVLHTAEGGHLAGRLHLSEGMRGGDD
jgi:transcriptional regulator with XRE-family HTH domain